MLPGVLLWQVMLTVSFVAGLDDCFRSTARVRKPCAEVELFIPPFIQAENRFQASLGESGGPRQNQTGLRPSTWTGVRFRHLRISQLPSAQAAKSSYSFP